MGSVTIPPGSVALTWGKFAPSLEALVVITGEGAAAGSRGWRPGVLQTLQCPRQAPPPSYPAPDVTEAEKVPRVKVEVNGLRAALRAWAALPTELY